MPLAPSANRLLAAMPLSDLALLRPELQPQRFEAQHRFARPGRPIEHVWFLESGLASTVAAPAGDDTSRDSHHAIEVVLTGREGCTGWPVVLQSDQSPNLCHALSAGHGLVIGAAALRRALQSSPTMRRALLNYAHVAMVQSAETARANARASLQQRLARWLLMAQDRQSGNELPFTHLLLSMVLGVRRAGVTLALQDVEDRGLIQRRRGTIVIVDHEGMVRLAGAFYGVPEAEYRRLIG